MTSNGAGRNGIGTGQVHLAGAAATREVAVLGADDDLIWTAGDAGASVDASSATGLDYMGSSFLEDIKITLADAVVAGFLRSELDVELD